MFWTAVEDFGRDHVGVAKVKAHLTRTAVASGKHNITFSQWAGNREADLQAKKGASLHGVHDDVKRRAAMADETVLQCAAWLGCSAARAYATKLPRDVSAAELTSALTWP